MIRWIAEDLASLVAVAAFVTVLLIVIGAI